MGAISGLSVCRRASAIYNLQASRKASSRIARDQDSHGSDDHTIVQ